MNTFLSGLSRGNRNQILTARSSVTRLLVRCASRPASMLFWAMCSLGLSLTGCAAQTPAPLAPAHPPQAELLVADVPQPWQALAARLAADGLYGPDLEVLFRTLQSPTQDPMGRKIEELYRREFTPPPPPPPLGTPPRPRVYVYPKVVTAENAATCRAFLVEHKAAFDRAARQYGVPSDIAVALMFIETRLGRSTGKSQVFYTLASMSASRAPAQIDTWLAKLDQPQTHLAWIEDTMRRRSDWAYKELTAFIRYARDNGIDPLSVPGSVYGAMGFCQFMPSNLAPYAADGNGDSRIDLFTVDDAVASLSNYLVQNGWKPGLSRAGKHAVLKRYNRLNIYANSILCLADMVRGEPMGKPVIPKSGSTGKAPSTKKTGKPVPKR